MYERFVVDKDSVDEPLVGSEVARGTVIGPRTSHLARHS
jgi:hypothetical protein